MKKKILKRKKKAHMLVISRDVIKHCVIFFCPMESKMRKKINVSARVYSDNVNNEKKL